MTSVKVVFYHITDFVVQELSIAVNLGSFIINIVQGHISLPFVTSRLFRWGCIAGHDVRCRLGLIRAVATTLTPRVIIGRNSMLTHVSLNADIT